MILLLTDVPCFAAAKLAAPPLYEFAVREAWIPMKDGVRVSATLYVPTAKRPGEKFPATLDKGGTNPPPVHITGSGSGPKNIRTQRLLPITRTSSRAVQYVRTRMNRTI
jgi:predicted acyl esterase